MKFLSRVIESVIGAGRILAAEWERPGGPRGTGDKADVDIEIEQVLHADLTQLLNCDFWGEETESRLTGAEYCWVVDPNDGTADFLKGRRGSALSIGLLRDAEPILGVVYAPVTDKMGSDCIAWEAGMSGIFRNRQLIKPCLLNQVFTSGSQVLVSTAASAKPELNAELCSPASFTPMPSIAYRLALAAAGDAIAGISLVPVGAHDVVAGHALLIGAQGVLLNQEGDPVTYNTQSELSQVSSRCFGGAPDACSKLALRDWGRLFRDR
ncbi:inositol monophosphatase [Ectopseudomonas mendocina]|nr:inositol monophosphatase [Pseudomonas mendocina]